MCDAAAGRLLPKVRMTSRVIQGMHVTPLHPWDLPPSDAVALQRELASRLSETDAIRSVNAARLIGGLDVSSVKDSPLLTAGVVVWNRETGQVTATAWAQGDQTFPYVPGLLSFREIPILASALEKLSAAPDILMVDGQGQAHPRRLGIAAHLGLLVDIPTIGVAKSILCGHGEDPPAEAGAWRPLLYRGAEIGRILRTKATAKPVYVSAGNRIRLETAADIAMACARGYRLPEPTRLAHLFVNRVRTGQPEEAQLTLL
jgi:deoxyribonuclease V